MDYVVNAAPSQTCLRVTARRDWRLILLMELTMTNADLRPRWMWTRDGWTYHVWDALAGSWIRPSELRTELRFAIYGRPPTEAN